MPARNFWFKLFLLVISSFFFLFFPKPALAEWTKYSGNPIFSPTVAWEGQIAKNQMLIYTGTEYKMWYEGNNGSGWRIGYAVSKDGLRDWTKRDSPVLKVGSSGEWNEIDTEDPFVFYDPVNGYRMWYLSISSKWPNQVPDRFRLRYATSTDGINWTDNTTNSDYVLKGSLGSWDSGGPARGKSILYIDGLYHMWYAGTDDGWNWKIGYATSNDGLDWDKQNGGEPVITPDESWEFNTLTHPSVLYGNGLFEMWYTAGYAETKAQIVYATSTDGVHWEKPADKNPALQAGPSDSWEGGGIWAPFILKQGNLYKIWYTGSDVSGTVSQIGYAEMEAPTLTPLQPLVLLPGLGGSWNHQEIFLGIDQPQSSWYKTPFRTDYDGLIQTLQNAGYTLGENLFVFYYDWLQPINQSADELKDYINDVVNPPPETKIDLVGHSLGGLVARTYIQRNSGIHRVDQLITLGSPHKGAPQVYKAWEGADLTGLLGEKERIGAGILLRLRGFSYPNLVQAIQNLVPSLGNLLFIEDYLKWNNTGIAKPESAMSQQNTWLKGLGVSPELLALTSTIIGTGSNTPRWLKIIERSKIDELLGQWEDGKPINEEFASGDRTVLEESAKLLGANIVNLAGLNHGDLVKSNSGQEKILELLGLSGVEIAEQPEIPFEPALVFTVASPVNLRVTDPLERQIGAGIDPPQIPNATFSAQEKIIIIPQAVDGEYKVEIISEGDGSLYQLLIGQLTENQDIWSRYEDKISNGETDTFTIPIDQTLTTTDSYLANLINLKLENLLKEIRQQEINPRVKAKLMAKILKILAQTKPLETLLNFEKNKLASKFVQRAIEKTINAIDYAEKFNPASLVSLRETLDLLGKLYQLLE